VSPVNLLEELPQIERELGLLCEGRASAFLRSPDSTWLVRPSVLARRLTAFPFKPHIVPILSKKRLIRLLLSSPTTGFERLPIRAGIVNLRPSRLGVPRVVGLYMYEKTPVAVKIAPAKDGKSLLDRAEGNMRVVREVGILQVPSCSEPAVCGRAAFMVTEYVDAVTPYTQSHRRAVIDRLVPDLLAHYRAHGIESISPEAIFDQQFFDDLSNAMSRLAKYPGAFTEDTFSSLFRIVCEGGDLLTSFCHSDLNKSHIGFCKSDGRIVIIDWGAASVKPIGYDMARLAEIQFEVGPDFLDVAVNAMHQLIGSVGTRETMPAERQLILGVFHRLKWWLDRNRAALQTGSPLIYAQGLEQGLAAVAQMVSRLQTRE
jgi:hypothetical protein